MQMTIHAIDRDNGDGRYERRHCFGRFTGPTNITDEQGRVLCQDTDGGPVAEIVLPEGARLFATKAGAEALAVPACEIGLSADDALTLARDQRFGLRLA